MTNETILLIATISAVVFDMLNTMIYMDILFRDKKRWAAPPVRLIFFTGVTALFFFIPSGTTWIFFLTLEILRISFFTLPYKSLLPSKIFAAASLTVFGMISEVAAMGILICSVNLTRITILPEFMTLYGAFLSKPLKFLLIISVRLILKRNSAQANLKNFLCLLMIPMLSVFIIVALVIGTDGAVNLRFSSVTAVLGILIINFIVYYMLNNIIAANEIREKQAMLETQLVFQEQKYRQTYASFRSISGIIHDTNKHLLYLRECAVQGDTDEAVRYINTAMNTLEKSYQRVNTGHLVIDALVSNAYNTAKQNGIVFKTDIKIDKDRITAERYDLSIVLGNLLDNAVEACLKLSPDDERFINVGIFTSDTALVINVINSAQYGSASSVPKNNGPAQYSGHMPNTVMHGEAFGTEAFKSDKPDRLLHGCGLKNINMITEKYGGSFVTEHDGSRFEATAILPVSP